MVGIIGMAVVVTWMVMAKTVTIVIDGIPVKRITTWQSDVAGALTEGGIRLEPGDKVEPALDEALRKGMEIRVHRSFPVELVIGGKARTVRVTGGLVSALLEREAIELGPWDRVIPEGSSTVKPEMRVEVIRVTKENVIVREEIPYAVKQWAEPTLEKGKTRIVRQGEPGLREKVWEVTYENGKEVNRRLVETRIVRQPRDHIIGIGTRTVWRTVATARGPLKYREVREMIATAYYPGPESTGQWADGLTATGVRAGRGVVAVDPQVIPLGTRLYIPGYGEAVAADVGGAIKGNRIDLCFDTYREAIQFGRRLVRVYLLD